MTLAPVSEGTHENVARRRAVEALRSGVPSWDAVAVLGSGQPEAEDRFTGLLDRVAGRHASAAEPRGLLLGGGFGGGKSHLLTHFGHLAMSAGFAVSTVVISKETPLHDPAKTFRAAVDAAVDPSRAHGILASAAALLDPDTPVSDLRRALKSVGAAGLYSFTPITARDLARQRFRFAAALLRAAGHEGWVVLFDEVELIGRYSLLQRGRSYAELGRWLTGQEGDRDLQLIPVFAMTDDFEAAVLTGKNDRTDIPVKLRAKQSPEWDETAALAEAGMRRIEHDMVLLAPPDDAELDRAYTALKKLHAGAFGWSPPDVAGLERLGATRMRQYVRAWINEWDLLRLDPSFSPQSVAVDIASDYREDADLEADYPSQKDSGEE